MAFQFQCPQGHLLEGEPSQAGQQCTCPMCGMLFIIPQPIAASAYMPAPPVPQYPAAGQAPQFPIAPQYPAAYAPAPLVPQYVAPPAPQFSPPPAPQAGPPSFPQVGVGAPVAPVINTGSPCAAAAVDVTAPAEPTLLHIPCPKGHELEVPLDMLDQDVLCPHCNSQFRLRKRDSVEYKRKKEVELERRDHKRGQAWLNWAIFFAIAVVLGLIVMVAASRK